MVSKCTWNIFSALGKKKKQFKEKKNHINNKTKPRSLKMVMLKLNHKLPYNSKMLRFFIFNSDDSQTYWNGYAYTLARFPSDCVKQIYCFYLLFYSLLSLLATALQQLLLPFLSMAMFTAVCTRAVGIHHRWGVGK